MNLDELKAELIYWKHASSWTYEFDKIRQRFYMKAAWALPKKLAYWATIRVGANATTGKYGNQVVPELYFMDALKRWDDK